MQQLVALTLVQQAQRGASLSVQMVNLMQRHLLHSWAQVKLRVVQHPLKPALQVQVQVQASQQLEDRLEHLLQTTLLRFYCAANLAARREGRALQALLSMQVLNQLAKQIPAALPLVNWQQLMGPGTAVGFVEVVAEAEAVAERTTWIDTEEAA